MLKIKKIIIVAVVCSLLLSIQTTTFATSDNTETATIVKEITEERTDFSKTYLLSNGLKQCEIFSNRIHYKDNRENYQEINIEAKNIDSLKNNGYSLKNTSNDWQVFFGDKGSSESMVRIEKDEYSIDMSMICDTKDMKATKGNNITNRESGSYEKFADNPTAVLYENAYNNVSLAYEIREDYLKEYLVLEDIPNTNEYKFDIEVSGVSLLLKDNTLYYNDNKTNETIFHTDNLFMEDCNGNYSNKIVMGLAEISEGKYELTLTIDNSFLTDKDTVYPVYVDPTVVITGSASTYDTFVSSSRPTTRYYLDEKLRTGRDETIYYEKRRIYVYFVVPSVVYNNTIENATISLLENSREGSTNVRAFRLTSSWPGSSAIYWNNVPSSVSLSSTALTDRSSVGAYYANDWCNIDVTDMVSSCTNGSNTYCGFLIKDDVENNYNVWTTWYSSDYSLSYKRPRMTITYDESSTYTTREVIGVYGGNYSADDAEVYVSEFAESPHNYQDAYYEYQDSNPDRLIQAGEYDVLYWSGHGSRYNLLSYGYNYEGASNGQWFNWKDKLNIPSSSSFNSTVKWNSSLGLRFVTLAACYQMSTSYDNDRLWWARAMLGSTNPVNNIVGYAQSGPSSPADDNVVEYMLYSSTPYMDNSSFSFIEAWLEANDDAGLISRDPGALYHASAVNAKPWGFNGASSPTINTGISPTIMYTEYNSIPIQVGLSKSSLISLSNNTVDSYSINMSSIKNESNNIVQLSDTLYPIIQRIDNNEVVNNVKSEILKNDYDALKVNDINQYALDKSNIEQLILFYDTDNKEIEMSKEGLEYYTQIEEYVKKYFDINKLALYEKVKRTVCDIDLETGDSLNQKTVSQALTYAYVINKLPISPYCNNEFLRVRVNSQGMEKVYYNQSSYQSTKSVSSLISYEEALITLTKYQKENPDIDLESEAVIEIAQLVYSNALMDSKDMYAPVWEFVLDNGQVFHISDKGIVEK